MIDLSGKTIVVTGGSSGIGRAMAFSFARQGAHVVVADVQSVPREGGEPTASAIAAEGASATFVQTDVSRTSDVERLVETAAGISGRLDAVVNNAVLAGPHNKGILETTDEDWDVMMAVGLKGVFLCCRAALGRMLDQPAVNEARGRIVNISSQVGVVGVPGCSAYCTLKGGVIALTRQLAVEFGPKQVVVNAIAPGKILTTPLDEPDTPETIAFATARTPFHRLGRPEDVAAVASFLVSDICTFMSGEVVAVDGGWLAA
jgi:NAD(P)-dependent dehydrogenase (short-subunit alcohol dehydrogenase family)